LQEGRTYPSSLFFLFFGYFIFLFPKSFLFYFSIREQTPDPFTYSHEIVPPPLSKLRLFGVFHRFSKALQGEWITLPLFINGVHGRWPPHKRDKAQLSPDARGARAGCTCSKTSGRKGGRYEEGRWGSASISRTCLMPAAAEPVMKPVKQPHHPLRRA